MSQALYLKRNLFVQECDGTHVFLDVSHNRYFMLSDVQSRRLTEVLRSSDSEQRANKNIEKLKEVGIVTQDSSQGKPFSAVPYEKAEFSILYHIAELDKLPTVRELSTFFYAFLVALRYRRLSHSTLETVVDTVTAWKSRLPSPSSSLRFRAIALTLQFHRISPYVFTAHDACFFRSLFLVRYLALHGLAADWVFAVRLCPFAAHCWVEFDHVLLNEDCDRTLEYRPIMIV